MHEDGARVHGKVQEGDRAERDNGARGRCTGAREGAGNGAASDNGCTRRGREGTGAERDNGARGRCIRVKGTGARVHGKVQEGDPVTVYG